MHDLAVNLTSPTVVLCVEVLPVMGRLFAGLAVLPMRVCTPKKLGVRPVGDGFDPGGGGAHKRGAARQAKGKRPDGRQP